MVHIAFLVDAQLIRYLRALFLTSAVFLCGPRPSVKLCGTSVLLGSEPAAECVVSIGTWAPECSKGSSSPGAKWIWSIAQRERWSAESVLFSIDGPWSQPNEQVAGESLSLSLCFLFLSLSLSPSLCQSLSKLPQIHSSLQLQWKQQYSCSSSLS